MWTYSISLDNNGEVENAYCNDAEQETAMVDV